MRARGGRRWAVVLGLGGALVCVGLAALGLPREPPGARGPYLQNLRQEGQGAEVTVCWTTQGLVSSEAQLRPLSPLLLPGSAVRLGDGVPRRRHEVVLGGLEPDAEYEYEVRTGDAFGARQRFRTPPATPKPFRFAAFGDFGAGTTGQQAVVQLLKEQDPAFTVVLGDLAYPTGSEGTLTRLFFKPLAEYGSRHVVWPVWGNHDVMADGGKPLDRASVTPGNGPEGLRGQRNYSFDYGDVHCVVVDANLERPDLRERVRPWLEADLAQTRRRWKFVFTHHPPFSASEHGDTARLKDLLVPVFSKHGVTAVFSGHDHLYQRLKPVDGVTYVVSGAGGAELYAYNHGDSRLEVVDAKHHGLTVVDVGLQEVKVRQLAEDGTAIDTFTLPAPPVAEGEAAPQPVPSKRK